MEQASAVLAALEKLAGEREKTASGTEGSGNYISVNEKYNMQGQPYCGTAIRYAFDGAGSRLLKDCQNPAYVPTLMQFCAGKGWTVKTPQKGCIFAYKDDHAGLVYEYSGGNTIITLEGNSVVRGSYAQAKNGTGAEFEGIGWKKRSYDSNYTFYMPPYDGAATPSQPGGEKHFTCTPTVDIVQDTSAYAAGACRAVQALLNAKFGAGLDLDGILGTQSTAALKAAQKKLGVTADGSCGRDTWTKLIMY